MRKEKEIKAKGAHDAVKPHSTHPDIYPDSITRFFPIGSQQRQKEDRNQKRVLLDCKDHYSVLPDNIDHDCDTSDILSVTLKQIPDAGPET